MTVAAAGADPCPRCGEPLPADANFCPNCGAPVSVSAASERRVVTVVFVDLAGSTELAARLDPERFREVIAAFHGMVTDEIAWLGGRRRGLHRRRRARGVRHPGGPRRRRRCEGSARPSPIRDRAERLGDELGLPIAMHVRDRRQHRAGRDRHGHRPQPRDRRGGEHRRADAAGGRARTRSSSAPPPCSSPAASVVFGEPQAIDGEGLRRPSCARGRWSRCASGRRRTGRTSGSSTGGASWRCSRTSSSARPAADAPTWSRCSGEPGIGKSRVVEEFLAGLPADDEGAERQVQPVRGGGHVLAARADGLSRAGRAARRARGRRGAEAPRRARGVARRSGGGRALGPAARVRARHRRGGRRGRPLPRGRGAPRHAVAAGRARRALARSCSCSRTSNRRTRCCST